MGGARGLAQFSSVALESHTRHTHTPIVTTGDSRSLNYWSVSVSPASRSALPFITSLSLTHATLRDSARGAGVDAGVVNAWRDAASDEKANSSMRW